MNTLYLTLEDVCAKGSSNIAQKDLENLDGEYEIYGASGLIKKVNFFHQEKPYIAIVKDGAGVGRTMLLPEKSSVIGTMQYIIPSEKVDIEYLYYAITFMDLSRYYMGAAIPHIYFKDYCKERIPVPEIEVQKKIAYRLRQIDKLISSRQKQLSKLSELTVSRFVELFGGKTYPAIMLDDLSLGKGEYGAQSASMEYEPNRPRYVRITDINDDGTLNDDFVSSSNIDDDEQYKLNYGDFLFARMGATVGKTYAYKFGNQIFAGYLIRYRLNLEKITPEYLYAFTKTEEYKNWVILNQSGAAQPGINAKKYGSLKVPVAPLEKQQAFAAFVEQTDKSRFVEWFGDVIRNTKQWKSYTFSDITTSRLGKMLDTKQQTGESSYPYLANFNVQWFSFELDNLNRMDFSDKDKKEFALEDGDLLVCEGGEIGRCAIWHNEVSPCYFQKALHRVRCNREIIIPIYLAWWFKFNCENNGFSAIEGAKATIAHLPGAKLKQLSVVVPPLNLQNKFAAFVEQTDKSKFVAEHSVSLYQSLLTKGAFIYE